MSTTGSNAGSAYVEILPSLRGFPNNLSGQLDPASQQAGQQAGKKAGGGFKESFGEGLKGLGALAAGAFAIDKAKEFIGEAISASSDLSESASKVNVVFGAQAGIITSAAETSAKSMGLSKQAYLENASSLGNLLVALKVAPKTAATMSASMVKLAGDLASFNNTSPEDALDALRSGLTGETEPLKRYGVNINQAMLQQQALKLGLIKTTKEALSPQNKALATQALIFDQTKTAQGDFARTSGGLANQQRILSAEVEDVKAKVGTLLLPVLASGAQIITGVVIPAFTNFGAAVGAVAGFIEAHQETFKIIGVIILTLLLPALVSMATTAVVTAATTVAAWVSIAGWSVIGAAAQVASAALTVASWVAMGVQSLLSAAKVAAAWLIAMGPIAIVIAAVVGLAILIYKNWDSIKRWTGEAWQAVSGAVSAAWDAVVSAVKTALNWVITFVSSSWTTVKTTISEGITAVVGFFSGMGERITNVTKALFHGIEVAFDTAKGWVSTGVDAVVGFFTGMGQRLDSATMGLFDGIKNAFKAAINWVIDAWNSLQFTIPGVDTHIPGVGKVGGFTLGTPDIPRLAKGGIVNKPTIALIGEAGPEAVVPLGKGHGVGATVVVNNYGRDVSPATVVTGLNNWHTINGAAIMAGV